MTGKKDAHLEFPANEEHGDYSTNIAMTAFGKKEKILDRGKKETIAVFLENSNSPRELAEKIVEKLKDDKKLSDVVEKIETAGPGFINFWLKKEYLLKKLYQVLQQKSKYGKADLGKGKTVIVEYSSPNIAKPFTIGHLRSTIIGDAVANLFQAIGYNVYRDNHLGDWGTQFGKQLYAIKTWGNEKEITKSKNPIKELVRLYVRFHKEAEKDPDILEKGREWFKKLEEGDEEARRLWQKCINWSWKEFDKIYGLLDVEFSEEFQNGRGLGESFFEDKMQEVIKELEEKEMLKEGEKGAKLVFFPNDKYPPAMILKKDGTTLYHTRDLATDKYRKENFDPDLIINEVGAEQTLYFKQLFEIEKMLGWFEESQRIHISHGLIRFKKGKMSTRKGDVIWLENVLKQATQKAKEIGSDSKKLAQSVGIGALKYNDLKRDPKTEIIFNWDEILNMEGNSGPYLQYTYARAKSVLDKAGKKIKADSLQNNKEQTNPEELSLMRHFVRFSETIIDAGKNYSPNILCNYLYELAQKYNTFYNKHQIVGNQEEEKRLALTAATAQILKNGLTLLGIDTPEKM